MVDIFCEVGFPICRVDLSY